MFDRSAVKAIHDLTLARTRKWLVLGKGPTSDRLPRVDLDLYNVLTLNHACRLAPPAVAHFVDAEAVLACMPRLTEPGVDCLVAAPWHPHVGFKAGVGTLDEYPWSFQLGGRLVGYNATTASNKVRNVLLPTVRLRQFGATAAFALLAAAGVRHIDSLGVDGGTGYGHAFSAADRLANGRKSFDSQFPWIEDVLRRNKVTWTRLFRRDG